MKDQGLKHLPAVSSMMWTDAACTVLCKRRKRPESATQTWVCSICQNCVLICQQLLFLQRYAHQSCAQRDLIIADDLRQRHRRQACQADEHPSHYHTRCETPILMERIQAGMLHNRRRDRGNTLWLAREPTVYHLTCVIHIAGMAVIQWGRKLGNICYESMPCRTSWLDTQPDQFVPHLASTWQALHDADMLDTL